MIPPTPLLPVLTGRLAPGAWRTGSVPDSAASELEAAGWSVMQVEIASATDKADVLGRLASAGQFPSYFGQNWDALYDCLTDLSWSKGRRFVLIVRGADGFVERHPTQAAILLAVLEDTSAYWAQRAINFTALWEGTEPAVLPSLDEL